jgi:hypothetical protein
MAFEFQVLGSVSTTTDPSMPKLSSAQIKVSSTNQSHSSFSAKPVLLSVVLQLPRNCFGR